MTPTRAMVLAAGLGTRLRPLTDHTPKPLIEVAGHPLIDGVLDRLTAVGVTDVVVNTHHLAERIEAHLANRDTPHIEISREETLLDTGGGVRKALPLLGDAPFFVVNSDIVWRNSWQSSLAVLARAWRNEDMDALLLQHRTVTAFGYRGRGDFMLDPLGRLRRRGETEVSPCVFTGIQILAPALFDGAPDGAFSLNLLYDRAAREGRLHGFLHDGDWFLVDTPDGMAAAEAELTLSPGARARRMA